MSNLAASPCAFETRTHALPVFEAENSRRHVPVSMWRLHLQALVGAVRHARHVHPANGFVQFAGWPRSGHSLVGALIDAHPQAAIAHELDSMGLFHKGIPAARLPALCLWNARRFTSAGRWWNGFRYAVPDATHGPTAPLAVIGDKKGDWATRWFLEAPELLDRLARESALKPRWILVTRHPADNVATMSLRRGKAYDRLRIARGGDFEAALRTAQENGEIAAVADDGMISDYARLADGVARMKARVPREDWIEIVYERLGADTEGELRRIESFLGLRHDPTWSAAAARLVRPSRRRSRDLVAWSPAQRTALRDIIREHDFLDAYAEDT